MATGTEELNFHFISFNLNSHIEISTVLGLKKEKLKSRVC